MKMIWANLVLLTTAFLSLPYVVAAAPSKIRANAHVPFLRFGGVQGVRTFEQLPFPTSIGVSSFVFAPDGTAYWSGYPNELDSFTPSGELRRISVPHAGGNASGGTILYARGDMWMFGDTGIVKVRTDGTARRWYPFTSPGFVTDVLQMAFGPDGGIYVLALSYPRDGSATQDVLFRIGTNGILTSITLPVTPQLPADRSAVFGSDGLLYFGYGDTPLNALGIARVERNGSVTLFPTAYASSFVASKGSVYFDHATYQPKSGTFVNDLGRLTTAGIISYTPLPTTGQNVYPSYLTVDKGGNLWTTLSTSSSTDPALLYQFNVYTGRFNGPYLSASSAFNGSPVVAPNDSIYVPYGQRNGATFGFDVFALPR